MKGLVESSNTPTNSAGKKQRVYFSTLGRRHIHLKKRRLKLKYFSPGKMQQYGS